MTDNVRPLAAWAEEYTSRYPPRSELSLHIAGCSMLIRSNSAALVEALTANYALYAAGAAGRPDVEVTLLEAPPPEIDAPLEVYPPGPGKTVIKDEYADVADGRVLRKRLTGMVFLVGDGISMAIGPCLENRNQAINFVNNRFIQWNLDRGYLLCHAAGTALGSRGLALAGMSGAGKSTLALDLLAAGCDFVSNDRLLIRRVDDAGVEMRGVPKLPRINPGTILHNPQLRHILSPDERRALKELPPEELWKLEQKYDADVQRWFEPGHVRIAAPLTAAAILTWRHGGGPAHVHEVDLAERCDLLRALIKSLGVHYRVPEDYPQPHFSEDAYLAVLGGVQVVEITGGVDFPRAAEACLELLRSGTPG